MTGKKNKILTNKKETIFNKFNRFNKKKLIDMFAVWEYEEDIFWVINLIFKS